MKVLQRLVLIGLVILPAAVPAAAQVERSLTLQDAIQMALENNLDIQVSRYNPQISDTDLEREKAQFDSSVEGTVYTLHEERPAFFIGQAKNRENSAFGRKSKQVAHYQICKVRSKRPHINVASNNHRGKFAAGSNNNHLVFYTRRKTHLTL